MLSISHRREGGADSIKRGNAHSLTHRQALSKLLHQVLSFARPCEEVLREFYHGHPTLGARDRRRISDELYVILRHFGQLKRQGIDAPEDLADWVMAGNNMNEPYVAQDFPAWLFTGLAKQYEQKEALELLRGLMTSAPLDIRLPLALKREAVVEKLAALNIGAQPTNFSPLGVRLTGKPNVRGFLKSNNCEIQDEGSQIICYLVAARRGETVVDFCAGVGGKSLTLATLMDGKGQIYALDVDAVRLKRLVQHPSAHNIISTFVLKHKEDPHLQRWAGKMDRVLVDAPCSGLGTLRRQPDLLWRRKLEEMAGFVSRQSIILSDAASLVRVGGHLIYATCSVWQEENQGVIEKFMRENPNFERVDAQKTLSRLKLPSSAFTNGDLVLLPHLHYTDGFYAAHLRRAS